MIMVLIVLLLLIVRMAATDSLSKTENTDEYKSVVNAMDSDFWLLEIAKSTIPVETAGQGLFAKANIPKDNIICEKRGPIIDEEAQAKLPYNDKIAGMKHNGKNYGILVEGICSYINDCSNAMMLLQQNSSLLLEKDDPSQCFENFSYNAAALTMGPKIFVVSTREILAGEEIFINYKWPYWQRRYENKNIINFKKTKNTEVSEVLQDEYKSVVNAMDSDFWLLELAKSSIPVETAGQGVFAKAKIQNNDIICEYRGPIIDEEGQAKLPYNDKLFGMKHNGKNYSILGEGICSYINDCSNAMMLLQQNSSLLLEKDDPSQCFENFSYNAKALTMGPKIFVVSTREILPGEEIFISYKWPYWQRRYQQKIKNLPEAQPIVKVPPL